MLCWNVYSLHTNVVHVNFLFPLKPHVLKFTWLNHWHKQGCASWWCQVILFISTSWTEWVNVFLQPTWRMYPRNGTCAVRCKCVCLCVWSCFKEVKKGYIISLLPFNTKHSLYSVALSLALWGSVCCSLPVYPLPSPLLCSFIPRLSFYPHHLLFPRVLSFSSLSIAKEWKASFLINSLSVRAACVLCQKPCHILALSLTYKFVFLL